ncbi:MAG TPA: hypothetical protein VG900_02635 [Hyphomicrobiaceae bacterium]|jgi:hypothetical protein|nr:hypothetical protein [Hyphomicrobiaceae bacterium]
MTANSKIALLELRRDNILSWLDDEAPYTAADQKHLDQDTPERAYWHYGYQAALTDVIELLTRAEQKSGNEGIPK